MLQSTAAGAEIFRRENRARLLLGALLIWTVLMVATPRVSHSPSDHHFADMRNFLGVPNTLNVLTSFPFLVVGVPALVLCFSRSCFSISSKGEVCSWTFFFAGIVAMAFGSAYYHLKPDDDRIIWDRLPIMISTASLLSTLIIERVDERTGTTCLFCLMSLAIFSVVYESFFDDHRLSMLFHLVPPIAIPAMILLHPPKYTHASFWVGATGFYLLSRFEAMADAKVYRVNHYIISGHSLEHLCLAMVSLVLAVMLWFRSIKIVRDS